MIAMLSILPFVLSAAAAAVVQRAATVPLPEADPFYAAPSGFESATPGTVFRSRPALTTGISGVNGTQLLFRTSDGLGNPAVSVTTVLVGPKSSKNVLVAYNPYQDSANTTCAASYLYNTDPGQPFGPNFGNEVSGGLSRGWTVTVSDYEGANSSFAVGHIEGYQALDGVRAALNYAPLGISKTAALGMFGYSGGALATGWAAALQPTYAPELKFAGFAFGGTPANISSTLLKVDGTVFAGFGAAGVAGQLASFRALDPLFNRVVTPAGFATIKQVRSQCATGDLISFAFQKFLSTKYQSEGPGLLTDPVVLPILQASTMGLNASETPTAPIYMYHGAVDEVIPYDSALAAAKSWCSRGAKIAFTTDIALTGHLGTDMALTGVAVAWLDGRLKGTQAAPTACTFTDSLALGLPLLKRRGSNGSQKTVIDVLGQNDSIFAAVILSQVNSNAPMQTKIQNINNWLKSVYRQ